MEASARGAREAGGTHVGITSEIWPRRANPCIVEEVRTQSFPQRLMSSIERANADRFFPGGTGTLRRTGALLGDDEQRQSSPKTVGGRNPLLVMALYRQPVIDRLSRKAELNDGVPHAVAAALDIVTLIRSPEQAAEELIRRL